MTLLDHEPELLKPQGRVLSTLESDGSRRWLYPKLALGRFLVRRRAVAYLLIAIFTLIPYLTINHKPAMLLDIASRRFTLFGFTFLPTDTVLLALFMVAVFLTIFLVTALLGRVWCGWACPQTVYLEFVFRPVERLFIGRRGTGGKPRADLAPWRLPAMYATYLLISLYLAHTFLAYFVGVEALRHWIFGSPLEHPAAFVLVVAVTLAMLFNFGFFREQTCTIACPYGRFQSVLMDRGSLIITYDVNRGEPRGPVRKASLPVLQGGDCVDCGLCAAVCPTGIDIRDGLQMECVGCAQCIDACDAVMDKVGRNRGLIRYSSQSAMEGKPTPLLRPRVLIYPTIIVALLGILVTLLLTQSPADVTVLRGLGRPFVMTESGEIENTMRIKITNRTDKPQRLRVSVADRSDVRVILTDDYLDLAPSQSKIEPIQVLAKPRMFTFGTLDVTLRVSDGKQVKVDRPCRLLGPMLVPHQEREEKEHEEHHD